jgi:hypothetical protein
MAVVSSSPAPSSPWPVLSIRAWHATDQVLERGVASYDRARMVSTLLRLWPLEAYGEEPETTRGLLARLRRALRRERALGTAGHPRYDVNRHIALLQAWRCESATLRQILGKATGSGR